MFTLLFLLPVVLTTLAVLVTFACMPMYWAALERPMAVEGTDWTSLEEELALADIDAAWDDITLACVDFPLGTRPQPRPIKVRHPGGRARRLQPRARVRYTYRDAKIEVFGVLADTVPARKSWMSQVKSGRGPIPPPPGGGV
jgi:hypothetical protein